MLSNIFDKDRLTYSRDTDTYNSRLSTLWDLIDELVLKRLGLTLVVHCSVVKQARHKPARQNKIPPMWTNKNSESANHIIKQATQNSSISCTKY